MSVCPSAWNNPAPRWTYFRELQYFCRFWKFVQKIRGSLKSDKNNGYYTRWPVHVYNVLLNSSSNEKCFRESCRENQNTHFMFNVQGEHKFFPYYKHLLQENYVEYKLFFFSKCNSTQEVCLQHISTLQHVLLLLHGERLFDNQFLSTCSPTCLQLL